MRTFASHESTDSRSDREVTGSSDDMFAVRLVHENAIGVQQQALGGPFFRSASQLAGPGERGCVVLGSNDVVCVQEGADIASGKVNCAPGLGR